MIDIKSLQTAQAERDSLETLFAGVDTLAELTSALAHAAASGKTYRLFSHVAIAEELQKAKRLADEFGSIEKAQELIDAFAKAQPALFGRAQDRNLLGHPAVASAMARVQESDP